MTYSSDDRPALEITDEMVEAGALALFRTLGPTDSPYTTRELAQVVLTASLAQWRTVFTSDCHCDRKYLS